MKVIVVRGGLVQSVYSDKREAAYVFDYDGDGLEEQKRREREMAALIKTHKLKELELS